MAVSPNTKTRVKMTKTDKTKEKSDKKLLIVAQEIKLAKILAGNNKSLRDRTLRKLMKWFEAREKQIPFVEDDFLRIWKGLFYHMWMADKSLFQEECAENISKLMDFKNAETSLMFFKCFLQTMMNEWFGIDQLRLDKFLMLTRRVLRRCFEVLKNANWDLSVLKKFQDALSSTVLKCNGHVPLGLAMHIAEIYLEELSKVSKGRITEQQVLEFVRPFANHLAFNKEDRINVHIKTHIFRYLMKQSDVGIEYEERFNAWRQLGYPGGTIDALDKVEIDEKGDSDDPESDALDPRAGKVHVDLPQLKFDCQSLIAMLEDLRFKPGTNKFTRRTLGSVISHFNELKGGNYPFGIKRIKLKPEARGKPTDVKNSLKRLRVFEEELLKDSRKAEKAKDKKAKINKIVLEELGRYKKPTEVEGTAASTLEEFIEKSEGGLMNGNGASKPAVVTPIRNAVKKRPPTPYPKKARTSEKRKIEKPTSDSPKKLKRNSGVWQVDDISETPTRSTDDTTVSKSLLKKRNGSERYDVGDKPEGGGGGKKYPIIMEHPVSETPTKKRSKSHLPASTPKNLLLKNPFSSPSSAKKVKIALDLNRSQDIREHIISLANSPKNPYDSSKKPGKKILKSRSLLPTAVNPFYKS